MRFGTGGLAAGRFSHVRSTKAKESASKRPPKRTADDSYEYAGVFSLLPVTSARGGEVTGYVDFPIGDEVPEIVSAVVEFPKGGISKYEYDEKLHVFRLDRNLHSPVHYPGDYGFIPQTIADDGDPLDILILTDAGTFPGCVYPHELSVSLRCSIRGSRMRR